MKNPMHGRLKALFKELVPKGSDLGIIDVVCGEYADKALEVMEQGVGGSLSEIEGIGPHGCDPTHCPTFFDYCHCTVECLEHNINRAEQAEELVEELEQRVTKLEKQMTLIVALERNNPVRICPKCENKNEPEHCLVCCGLGFVPKDH